MKFQISILLITLFVSPVFGQLPSIFNGKDLTGWKVPENNIWWKVDDGVLNIQNGPEKKGQTLWSEKEYKNFIMQFDFKYGEGTIDTGIYVRNFERADSDRDFRFFET